MFVERLCRLAIVAEVFNFRDAGISETENPGGVPKFPVFGGMPDGIKKSLVTEKVKRETQGAYSIFVGLTLPYLAGDFFYGKAKALCEDSQNCVLGAV